MALTRAFLKTPDGLCLPGRVDYDDRNHFNDDDEEGRILPRRAFMVPYRLTEGVEYRYENVTKCLQIVVDVTVDLVHSCLHQFYLLAS